MPRVKANRMTGRQPHRTTHRPDAAGSALRMPRNRNLEAAERLDEAAVVEDPGGTARFAS